MSTVNLVLAQNPNFRLVKVVFPTATKRYTYKTMIVDVEVGDSLVVYTPAEGLKVVVVESVHKLHEITLRADIHYKWVVQKIDFTDYIKITEAAQEAQRLINESETKKLHDEMLQNLQDQVGTKTLEIITNLVRI